MATPIRRHLLHHLTVFRLFVGIADDELMHQVTGVLDNELNRFAGSNGQIVGFEPEIAGLNGDGPVNVRIRYVL